MGKREDSDLIFPPLEEFQQHHSRKKKSGLTDTFCSERSHFVTYPTKKEKIFRVRSTIISPTKSTLAPHTQEKKFKLGRW